MLIVTIDIGRLLKNGAKVTEQIFHTALLIGTGNPFIVSLANGIRAAILTTTIYKQRKQASLRDPLPDHLRVFEAIAAQDPAGAQAAMSFLIHDWRAVTPPLSKHPVRSADNAPRPRANFATDILSELI